MIEEITKYDVNFNEAMFLSKADHIFIMILSAIMDNDISSVKHYLSDEIYEKFNTLVEGYKSKNLIRLFDEMNVKSTNISNVVVDNEKINIIVNLTSRYMDYFLNDEGDYVSGINDHRIELNHKIVFSKYLNATELGLARRCPSCGHNLDINASGVCPYCNSTIDMSKYDYIITEIDLI